MHIHRMQLVKSFLELAALRGAVDGAENDHDWPDKKVTSKLLKKTMRGGVSLSSRRRHLRPNELRSLRLQWPRPVRQTYSLAAAFCLAPADA